MGNDFHLQWATMLPTSGNEGIKMPQIPIGAQVVPQADPCWDPNDLRDEWRRHHFIYLVVEGLKRAKVKPLNYSQVSTVQQGCLFYSILRTQLKNIPLWTQSHRWGRFSRINF
jgi:hypothetical protein